MFDAKLSDITLLRESLGAIADLIDEAELRIKEAGLELVSSDRAVVAVVEFLLSRNAFSEYICDRDERIGINLASLMQILRRASQGDSLRLRLADNKLHLVIEGSSTRSFTLPLIDVAKEELPDMGKLEAGFSAAVDVDSEILNSGIDDAELVTDSVVVTVRKDMLTLKAEADASSTQLELPSGSEWLKVIDMSEPVRSRYSLDYLKKIFKARRLAEKVRMDIATDYPMRLQFEVPGKLKLSFILAPRVEE